MKELRGALALVGEYRMTPAARAARAHPGRVRQAGGGGDGGDAMGTHSEGTGGNEGAVSRFNIYGLKYSRNHTGGDEFGGERGRMTCRTCGGKLIHSGDVSRPTRAKIHIYIYMTHMHTHTHTHNMHIYIKVS